VSEAAGILLLAVAAGAPACWAAWQLRDLVSTLVNLEARLEQMQAQLKELIRILPATGPDHRFQRDDDVCEVLQASGDGWEHAAWVRVGSPAWQEAYDTPGRAVRSRSGVIDAGVS
jgi:hypothetical protein